MGGESSDTITNDDADQDGRDWVHFTAACRMMQAAHGWRASSDEAGRWILNRASAGKIKPHPVNVDAFNGVVESHRLGEPGMHKTVAVTHARWSLSDVTAELEADREAEVLAERKSPERRPKWDWPQIVAEAAVSYTLAGGGSLDSLIALVQGIAERQNKLTPSERVVREHAMVIVNAWQQQRREMPPMVTGGFGCPRGNHQDRFGRLTHPPELP